MAMAAKKKVETCSINSLPDEVLGQILSLIPTKLAAATSVLSKRWRNLLPLVHNLDFDESMVFYPNRTSETIGDGGGFLDFVNRTLVLLGDSPIKKFSMKWDSHIDNSQYNHLIRNVLEHGALELDLSSTSIQCIMPEFFFSKTLVKLTLSRGNYDQDSDPPDGVLFPALKTLSLVQVSYGTFGWGDLYDCLLNSCPVLEEVNIFAGDPFDGGGWRRHIWGSTIQRITIFYRFYDLGAHSLVGLDTPSLVYLDYSSYVAEDYQCQLDSLVEARLDLILWKYNDYNIPPVDEYFGYDSTKGDAWGDATKLVAAIRNVVTLHLSADSLEVFHCCCKSMPEFNNLVTLSFESHEERDWQVLPLLLKKSPNLETLVLKGLVHKFTKGCGDVCACKRARKKRKKKISCLLSCGVKVLKVYGYGGSCRELKQMRHFMENLRCLEVVKVQVQVDKQDKKYTDDLMKLLQTASSECKIQFI